ncbi:transcriptional repressor [Clostridiales bacterium COT073_COT-073]|nr:transcriptional repressor [Clostridiales bacterium COT073_COT-073]
MNDLTKYYEILKRGGYKLTNQRKVVLETLYNHRKAHLTVDEVYQFVRETNPEIGLATVYRNIQILNRLGIIEKISFDDKDIRYEIFYEDIPIHHYHLICRQCGNVDELELDFMDRYKGMLEAEKGFEALDAQIKIYGICKNCIVKNSEEAE